jgi:hypothetical protein
MMLVAQNGDGDLVETVMQCGLCEDTATNTDGGGNMYTFD